MRALQLQNLEPAHRRQHRTYGLAVALHARMGHLWIVILPHRRSHRQDPRWGLRGRHRMLQPALLEEVHLHLADSLALVRGAMINCPSNVRSAMRDAQEDAQIAPATSALSPISVGVSIRQDRRSIWNTFQF